MYIEKFKSHLEAELMRSPHTVRAYIDDITAFETYIAPANIQNAAYADIRSYVMVMVEREDSARSVNRRISALRNFFDFLVRSEVISKNPCAKIRAIRSSQLLPHFVPQDKINTIFEICQAYNQNPKGDSDYKATMMLKMLYYTGIRRTELASLDVESIDFSQKFIKFTGKGSIERIVPLTDDFLADIEQYLQIRAEKICDSNEKALFLGSDGVRIKVWSIYRTVNRVLTLAGVDGKKSPHVLRHTFATHLTAAGVGVRTVQELLGHRSIASTQIYAHNTIETLKKSYNSAHPRAKKK